MLERDIKKKIRAYLHNIEGFYFPYNPYHGQAGIPDILGVFRGLFVAIEVKAPSGKVSKLQQHAMDTIVKNGGLVCLAYSVQDVEDFFAKIFRIDTEVLGYYRKVFKGDANGKN